MADDDGNCFQKQLYALVDDELDLFQPYLGRVRKFFSSNFIYDQEVSHLFQHASHVVVRIGMQCCIIG